MAEIIFSSVKVNFVFIPKKAKIFNIWEKKYLSLFVVLTLDRTKEKIYKMKIDQFLFSTNLLMGKGAFTPLMFDPKST